MSLIGALNAAKTALAVQQAAIQVTGNNIANAGNAGYTRQTAVLAPSADQQIQPGMFLGTGVNLTAVQRNVDDALLARLRASVSDNEGADTTQQWLGRVEAVFNALGDQNLSTQMSAFFNSWSSLANQPQDMSLRQIVLQTGASLGNQFQDLRSQLSSLQTDADDRLKTLADNANALAQQVADLNGQIVVAEGAAGGTANALRDQRDTVLRQLSQLLDIKTLQDGNVVNVYVGSEPLVINADNRGVALSRGLVDGVSVTKVVFKSNGGALQTTSGQIGALNSVRGQIGAVIDQVDALAHNLIFELNKLHAGGQGLEGFSSVTGTYALDEPNAALNDSKSGIDFPVQNGSFVVHVRNKTTGLETSTLVQVDLDGLNGNDTTLNSLAAELNGIDNLSASVSAGQLKIQADSSDVEVRFSQDSSGTLAALGINTFFSGTDSRDITVNPALTARPALLAAAKNGKSGDNQTALAIAAMESQAIGATDGSTLESQYESMVNSVAVSSAAARNSAQAAKVVVDTLEAQREALSGVSLDEEAVNLMSQQRAFQGAARVIAAVDEMMKTMLNLI